MATRKRKTVVVVAEPTSTCKSCRHAFFDGEMFICRRLPPVPVFDIGEAEVCSYQPVVAPDGWCGEFGAKLDS
jgi:hypothetical protein